MSDARAHSIDVARRPRRRPMLGCAAAVVMAAALVGCGGDDGGSASDDARATTTTTTESTTTTAAPRADADPATTALADAGILQTVDFGAGWLEYSPPDVYTPTEESCAYREDGPEDGLLNGAAMSGPTVQLGEEPGYVSSRSRVFATEADAVAWVDIAKSDEWAQCGLTQAQEFQDDAGSDVTIRIDTRDAASLGESGFEAFVYFVGENEGGEIVYGRQTSVYRLGRTVIVTDQENGGLAEASVAPLDDGWYRALSAAYERVYALEPAQTASGAPAS